MSTENTNKPSRPSIQFAFLMHLNMGKKHITKYEGVLNVPGHAMDGTKVYREAATTVKGIHSVPGKTEVLFYIAEKDAPTFGTLKELAQHYKLI